MGPFNTEESLHISYSIISLLFRFMTILTILYLHLAICKNYLKIRNLSYD